MNGNNIRLYIEIAGYCPQDMETIRGVFHHYS